MKRLNNLALLWANAFLLCAGTAHAASSSTSLSFALIGDQPYNPALEAATDHLLAHIDQDESTRWIVHLGDIKGGGESCSNALIDRRLKQIQNTQKALVFIPGDNEWTDCHRDSNGNYNSQERLAHLRKEAFDKPETFGKNRFKVRNQSDKGFPEHQMWTEGSTLFITFNVPGSNNDLSNPSSRKISGAQVKQLFLTRQQAIDEWFLQAEQTFANNKLTETVVAIQGNPIDGSGRPWSLDRMLVTANGYEPFMKRLVLFAQHTGKPLLLAHGDTHRFRWDQPDLSAWGASKQTNRLIQRVEGWGHPFTNAWVKITIHQGTAQPFRAESITLPTPNNN